MVDMQHFLDDDAGYLAWLRDHPTGFVINAARTPRPDYLVMHRAECRHINGRTGVEHWTDSQYRKVCAESVGELERWARVDVPGEPSRCGHCQP
jgi:hypothetical protein